MHGGVKFYRGSATAARSYVEADRGRADDYYLAEGTGLAERLLATTTVDGDTSAQVIEGGTLDGDAYEAWVGGYRTDGTTKGRLRTDDQALRFVEVVVNGPKTWSLAAAVNPQIAAAYDAAQDQAAREIIGWLAEHATTRIGPRGRQVQVPIEHLEAAAVRHYTSRAGDPHRHLHLQINARVFAAGRWRGLHSVGIVDSIEAINGIGHAAVATDPQAVKSILPYVAGGRKQSHCCRSDANLAGLAELGNTLKHDDFRAKCGHKCGHIRFEVASDLDTTSSDLQLVSRELLPVAIRRRSPSSILA